MARDQPITSYSDFLKALLSDRERFFEEVVEGVALRSKLRYAVVTIIVLAGFFGLVAGAHDVITQDLGYEIARYVFGRPAEVRRQKEEDRQVQAALGLARRAKSPQDLLALAAAQAPATLRN